MITLTAEEEACFSGISYMAFSSMREAKPDCNIPCWLCTDPKIREEERQKAITVVRKAFAAKQGKAFKGKGQVFQANSHWINSMLTEKSIEQTLMASHPVRKQVEEWKRYELELKRIREEEHNPRAFFFQALSEK